MPRFRPRLIRAVVAIVAGWLLAGGSALAEPLRIGVTLHPYYSFVANIVGDRAEVISLIDANANPHGYMPQPDDMIRMTTLDALIVNGIGHDTWAFEILDAAGVRDSIELIYANDGVSLIPVAGDPSGDKVVNPHTFISTTAAIQQVYTIARRLGELDTDNAAFYRDNARQ
jgi:zinc transport system substrate-binding protein